jgi:hypothetical protein
MKFKHNEKFNYQDDVPLEFFKNKLSRLVYKGSDLGRFEFMIPVCWDGKELLNVRVGDENKMTDRPYIVFYEFIEVENESYNIVNLYRGKNPLYKSENKNV